LVVVTSPVLYASTGLRVKRGKSISFVIRKIVEPLWHKAFDGGWLQYSKENKDYPLLK
jgi:hypothetical protein